jgi:hypothetical protein
VDIENMLKIQHDLFDPNPFTIQDVIGAELYSFLSVKKTPQNKHLSKSQNHYKYGLSYGPIIDTTVQIFGKDATFNLF